MSEENFPDNPTRRSADKHMREAPNVLGSNPDVRKRMPLAREREEEDAGQASEDATDARQASDAEEKDRIDHAL